MRTPVEKKTGLVTDFLDVCNQALNANRDSLPYRPIILVFEKLFHDRQVECQIFDTDANDVKFSETVEFADGSFHVVAPGNANPGLHIKVKRSYMEEVVQNREEYIAHPERLDWDWFHSRFGMTS